MLTVYQRAIPTIEAQQQLLAIEAAVAPHLKPEALRRMTARYVAQAEPPRQRRNLHDQLLERFFGRRNQGGTDGG